MARVAARLRSSATPTPDSIAENNAGHGGQAHVSAIYRKVLDLRLAKRIKCGCAIAFNIHTEKGVTSLHVVGLPRSGVCATEIEAMEHKPIIARQQKRWVRS